TCTLAYDEYNEHTGHNGFRFPGDSTYHEHADGDTGALNSSSIQTIYSIADDTQAPSVDNPVGAMTVSPAPAQARFAFASTPVDGFDLVFTGTVAAGGTRLVKQYFALAASQAQVNRLASENVDALAAPNVTITQPAANGQTVHTATITVAGRASDNKAVTSLTVDGRPVTLHHGSFTTTVHLRKGRNTITVVASDAAGNHTRATRTIT